MGIELSRGDIVVCTLQGGYGKPRPGVVVQSDLFNPTHASLTLCPITTHLIEAPLFRLTIMPAKQNGLQQISQIMVDKITTLHIDKLRQKIGALSKEQHHLLNHALRIWLGLFVDTL